MLNGVQHHSFNSNMVPQGCVGEYHHPLTLMRKLRHKPGSKSWSSCGSVWRLGSSTRALNHARSLIYKPSPDVTCPNLTLRTVFSITSAYSHPTTR